MQRRSVRYSERSRVLIKFVSDATHGQHVMRVLRIVLQFLSQPINVRIDVALITFVLGAPNPIEQIVARPCTARLRRQQIEDLKLERREIDLLSRARDFMSTAIDNQ